MHKLRTLYASSKALCIHFAGRESASRACGFSLQKKVLPLLLAAMALLLMAGCGGVEAVLNTDLTTFDVSGLDYYNEYASVYGGSLLAAEGNVMMVITMTAQTEFDETKFKSYFCSEDGNSVARVYVDEQDSYDCVAVAYQEGADEQQVLYALVFEVPTTAQKAKLITLEAPNYPQVALKGKLPDGYLKTAPIRTVMLSTDALPEDTDLMWDDSTDGLDETSNPDETSSPTEGMETPQDTGEEQTEE